MTRADARLHLSGAAHPPAGLLEAFWSYERALHADDLAALDRLFAPGPHTIRGDAQGLLVGHDAISAFRGSRGGIPERTLTDLHVQVVDDDHALIVALTEPHGGGRGQQTQLWARLPLGWAVTAAHVSAPPPALDTRVWRVVGDPLVAGADGGPLRGHTVAVKDLYAVAGQRIGAGNPAWLAAAAVEARHAAAVQALVDAGADLRGLARTDEFAYSLAGANAHSGTPPNVRAPHRLPGGSSSGSAAAVALGHASLGLGTDTGGSVRVPAAYQGLYGIRTTHDLVSRDGLLALAPSFDTVGWLARDPATLLAVGRVLLPGRPPAGTRELVVVPRLVALADPDVAETLTRCLAALGGVAAEDWPLDDLPGWLAAFQTLQAWEAWREHGDWLAGRLDTLGADVRGRFAHASTVTDADADAAREQVGLARETIRGLVGDRVLVLPAASSVAPRIGTDLGPVREATMNLTCLAGLGGLPAVTLPTRTAEGLPCGVSLVAAAGRDLELLQLAADLA
ncbi:AtzH-like domain-containing protein [Nocardioides ferulae]|uniref:AtzH-like domain-containing protein n=1 Tax=Nocardioides ferulae TaxID=2340821 RepID=UPI001F0BACC2|nr:AtzH-like domain-containing protein [Nocardioides ferulae]